MLIDFLLFSHLDLLCLKLFKEHAMLCQRRVGVSYQLQLILTSLSVYLGQQFERRVPADGNLWIDTGVERFEARALGSPLLAEFVGAVAEHNSFVVADGSFGEVAVV